MDFKDLTPEQQEMAKACKSVDELAELAKSFGIQLSDEELAAAGGIVADGCTPYLNCISYVPAPQPDPECPIKAACPKLFSCVSHCHQLAS